MNLTKGIVRKTADYLSVSVFLLKNSGDEDEIRQDFVSVARFKSAGTSENFMREELCYTSWYRHAIIDLAQVFTQFFVVNNH